MYNRLVCTEHYDFQVLCRQGIYSAAYLTSELCAALAMWVCGSVKLCYGAMCGWKIWFLAVFGCCNLVFGKYWRDIFVFYWIVWACFWNSGNLVSLLCSTTARLWQAREEEHRTTARPGKFYPVELSVFYNYRAIEALYLYFTIVKYG